MKRLVLRRATHRYETISATVEELAPSGVWLEVDHVYVPTHELPTVLDNATLDLIRGYAAAAKNFPSEY